ncbi:MAG TPA: hypothetical protein VG326_21080 [Tepidisphaeraceae bacterium]|nr:hypothetical protein [Tepidisphaeraceae bacterium]
MRVIYAVVAVWAFGLTCIAQGGVASIDVDLPSVEFATQSAGDFSSAAVCSSDRADLFADGLPASSMYVELPTKAQPPVAHSDGPTVVPLPAAAPAGLLLLGMIGFVGLIRRMRVKIAAPI